MSLATSRETNIDKVYHSKIQKLLFQMNPLGFSELSQEKAFFLTCKVYDPLIIKLSCVSLSLVVLSDFELPTLGSERLQKVSDWHRRAEICGL